jgi:hypothetical protein
MMNQEKVFVLYSSKYSIMDGYSFNELADVHLMYGHANDNNW